VGEHRFAEPLPARRRVAAIHSLAEDCPAELAAGVGGDELAVSLLGETAVDEPANNARPSIVRVGLLVLGERPAPVVLALLGAPAAAAGAALARVLAGRFRLSAAIAARSAGAGFGVGPGRRAPDSDFRR
jgi:hypothetical protein